MEDLWKMLIGVVFVIGAIYLLLNALPAPHSPTAGSNASAVVPSGPRAPELAGISGYINTPNNASSFTLSEYIGKKVILIDFWTYTCINCIRTLPYLNAWNERYGAQGLLIVGVHSPEFEFEKNIDNVRAAVQEYGVRYPVVLDNSHATWDAYANRYWPHEYLINKDGRIVYDDIGEGGYAETERQIVAALEELNAQNLTMGTEPINATPVDFSRIGTPELYFGNGFRRIPLGNGPAFMEFGQAYDFDPPATLNPNQIYLSGRWLDNEDHAALASPEGRIFLTYQARSVNLVMAGNATVEVFLDGQPVAPPLQGADVINGSVQVHEERLYNLVNAPGYATHTLELRIRGNAFRAYAFTFG